MLHTLYGAAMKHNCNFYVVRMSGWRVAPTGRAQRSLGAGAAGAAVP